MMNKFFILLCSMPLLAFSQEANQLSKFRFGLYVSPELNYLSVNRTETTGPKMGFSSGLAVEFALSKK